MSHLYPLHYNFSCFYSICIFSYDKFCSIIKCPQELLYCFKPSRHLSLFHSLLLLSGLCFFPISCNLCWWSSCFWLLSCPHRQIKFQSFLVYTFLIHYCCCLLHPTLLRLKHRKPVSFPAKKSDYSSHLTWTLAVPQTAFLEIPWIYLHCPADCNKIICQMWFKFCVFSKGWPVCEGLAHGAIQPWINEHKWKAARVPWWGNCCAWPGRVCHPALSWEPSRGICVREYLGLRGVKALCAQRGGGSAAVCLDLYGEEEAQPGQTIANMLWRNIASLN